jgi:hypothetical protein
VHIGKLSDGYKSRIVFGMMAMRKPHMLMLDERNHHTCTQTGARSPSSPTVPSRAPLTNASCSCFV